MSQLILISGYPSSGKTHRAHQLIQDFTRRISDSADPHIARLKVHHVHDGTLGLSRDVYASAGPEKDARAAFSSAVNRLLAPDALVLADGPNYIKGFRYQLYCDAKAAHTPSCVVHVGTPVATCRRINDAALAAGSGAYQPDVFDNLVFRYEEPNGMNRWDAPLFTLPFDDPDPPCDAIWAALVGSPGKPRLVVPNAATVLKPASEQDYLYELDRSTTDVIAAITVWQQDHSGEGGASVKVPGTENTIELPLTAPSLPQLQRLRRQFIQLNRNHTLSKTRVRALFVDYLNDAFQK